MQVLWVQWSWWSSLCYDKLYIMSWTVKYVSTRNRGVIGITYFVCTWVYNEKMVTSRAAAAAALVSSCQWWTEGLRLTGVVSSCCTRSSHSLRDLADTKPSKSLEHIMQTTTYISFGDQKPPKVVVVEGWGDIRHLQCSYQCCIS